MMYGAIRSQIKKLARKAGIPKPVNPQSFRHSRATQLANKLTEAQMKEYFGWTQGSDMASVYIHMSGRDVDDALLKIHGLKKDDKDKKSSTELKNCPRCKGKNSATDKFCSVCGNPLDVDFIEEVGESGNEAIKTLIKMLRQPNGDEKLKGFLDAMGK